MRGERRGGVEAGARARWVEPGVRGTPGGSFRAGGEGAIAEAEEGSLHTLGPEDRPAVSPLGDPGALSETEGGDPSCSNPKGMGFL